MRLLLGLALVFAGGLSACSSSHVKKDAGTVQDTGTDRPATDTREAGGTDRGPDTTASDAPQDTAATDVPAPTDTAATDAGAADAADDTAAAG